MISANTIPLSGAISLGLSTTVQPAAIAGATLQAIWFIGQFQGVIRPATPIASLHDQGGAALLLEAKLSSAVMVASIWPSPDLPGPIAP
jgi:hypothetical protein